MDTIRNQMAMHLQELTEDGEIFRWLVVQPNVLLGSGMDVFTPVSQLPPPLCCQYEEDDPTPTTCQALEQAMHGTIAHTHLSSIQPMPNMLLGSATDVFIPVPRLTPPSCSIMRVTPPQPPASSRPPGVWVSSHPITPGSHLSSHSPTPI